MSTDKTSGENNSVWFDVKVPQYQSLGSQTINADVCVVGAGIAGLTTSYLLALEGKKVALLDAREILSGETGRTTAHLMSALDDRYYRIRRMHGSKGAKLAAESHMTAIDIIEQNSKRESIECDFARLDGYLFPAEAADHKEIEHELEAARDAGWVSARLSDGSVTAVDTGKAILFPNQGQFHPLKYCIGLAKAIQEKGGQIYTHTKGVEFKGGKPEETHVKTEAGGTIKCEHIVITNNTFNDSIELMAKEQPYRTYAIAGSVPKGSVKPALYWDTKDPYHYVRLSPKDNKSEWLIVGGEDHIVGQHSDYEAPYKNLESWTRTHFPSLTDVQYKWSGEVWEPIDLLGFMGHQTHDKENVYIITGDSGTGMTHTTIGAKIITDLIMKRPNPWTELYEPTRKRVMSAKEFAKHNMEVAMGYAYYLKSGDIKDIEDLKPGCGGVLVEGLAPSKHIACYKDDDGKVYKCSAVCTHLGGLVTWNSSEKSWDCPCHGSRFDKFGKCIQGPALKDLEKIQG